MNLDANKDGTTDAGEILAAVQGFISATAADVIRVLTLASTVIGSATALYLALHGQPVPVPTTGPVPVPALPDAPAPVPPPADTDAPASAPVDAVAPVGGAS